MLYLIKISKLKDIEIYMADPFLFDEEETAYFEPAADNPILRLSMSINSLLEQIEGRIANGKSISIFFIPSYKLIIW